MGSILAVNAKAFRESELGFFLEGEDIDERLSLEEQFESLRIKNPIAYKRLLGQLRINNEIANGVGRGENPILVATRPQEDINRYYRQLFMGIGEDPVARREYYQNDSRHAEETFMHDVEKKHTKKRDNSKKEPPPCPTRDEAREFGNSFADTVNSLYNGALQAGENLGEYQAEDLLKAFIRIVPVEFINEYTDALGLSHQASNQIKNNILDLKAKLKDKKTNGKKLKRSLTTQSEKRKKEKTRYENFRDCVYNLILLVKEYPSPALRSLAVNSFVDNVDPGFDEAFVDYVIDSGMGGTVDNDSKKSEVLTLKSGSKNSGSKTFSLWDICGVTIGHSLQSMMMPVYNKIKSTQANAETKKREEISELRSQVASTEAAIDESLKVLMQKLPKLLLVEITSLIKGLKPHNFDEIYSEILSQRLDPSIEGSLDPYIRAYTQIIPNRNIKPSFYRAYAEDFVSKIPIKVLTRFVCLFDQKAKISKNLYDRLRSENPNFQQVLLPEGLITAPILPSDLFKKLNSVIEPHVLKLDELKQAINKLSSRETNVQDRVKPLESSIDRVAKGFVSIFPSSFVTNIVQQLYDPKDKNSIPPLNWDLDQRIDQIKQDDSVDSNVERELIPLSRSAMSITKDEDDVGSLTASFLGFMRRTPVALKALFKVLGLKMPELARHNKNKFDVLVQSANGKSDQVHRRTLLEGVSRAIKEADESENVAEKAVLSQFVNKVVKPDREERRLAQIGITLSS